MIVKETRKSVLNTIKRDGRLIAATYDICAVIVEWLLTSIVLIDSTASLADQSIWALTVLYASTVFFNLCWILPSQCLLFRFFGLYRGFWRFASIQDLRKIVYASSSGSLILFAVLSMRTSFFSQEMMRIFFDYHPYFSAFLAKVNLALPPLTT